MTDTAGLVIQGTDRKNTLLVKVDVEDNGDRLIYNIIHGGGGSDILTGSITPFHTLIGHFGVELYGEDGNDGIHGSPGHDTLSGGSGDDRLVMTPGDDILDGGDGTDTYVVWNYHALLMADSVSLVAMEKLDIAGDVKIGDFDLTQFEEIGASFVRGNLTFTQQTDLAGIPFTGAGGFYIRASKFGDHLDLSLSHSLMTIRGAGGDDLIIGGQYSNTIDGQTGNDHVIGGARSDLLDGSYGDDRIDGGGGKDTIQDSDGNNTIHGGDGADTIQVSGGNNSIFGDDGNDKISFERGTQTVAGGDGDDVIYIARAKNSPGAEWIVKGGAGTDVVYGGKDLSSLKCTGVEQLVVGNFYHTLTISPGTLNSFDTVDGLLGLVIKFSSGGSYTWNGEQNSKDHPGTKLIGSETADHIDLHTSQGNWIVNGHGGNDVIVGGSYINSLYGAEGNDAIEVVGGHGRINGGIGDDLLYAAQGEYAVFGGDGNDELLIGSDECSFRGGKGQDTYAFSNDSGVASVGDFHTSGAEHDIIDLSAVNWVKNFNDMIENHLVEIQGGIAIGSGGSVIALYGISAQDLHASNFIF